MRRSLSLTINDTDLASEGAYSLPSVLLDYLALTKPEINFLIAMTTAAVGLGSPAAAHVPWLVLLCTVLGTVLLSSGAGVLNRVIELHLTRRK
jgi:heme O synthase-like polyprenyltransferase